LILLANLFAGEDYFSRWGLYIRCVSVSHIRDEGQPGLIAKNPIDGEYCRRCNLIIRLDCGA
jgi:hypothetical protein